MALKVEGVGASLVERLRSEAANWSATCGSLFDEAATEIEHLKAENDRLRLYGENMRVVCQQQAREIERLDPTRPRAEHLHQRNGTHGFPETVDLGTGDRMTKEQFQQAWLGYSASVDAERQR